MAKLKLPTADSFMAMLDRIPADDDVAQPLAAAEPSPTPAAEVTPTIALVPPKPVKATHVVPPSPAPDAMSDGQPSDREISDSQLSNGDIYDRCISNGQLFNSDIYDRGTSNGQSSNSDIYDRGIPNGQLSSGDIYNRCISNGQPSNGGIYDGQLSDGGIVDYTTVERSTMPPSDIQPLNIPQSDISRLNVSPSDILPPNSKISDRETSDGKISDRSIYDLPYNQIMVLRYLINAPGRTSMKAISIGTGVKVPSAKDAVSRLVRRGFLANPSTIRTAEFQGFAYVLNRHMVDRFLDGDGLSDRDISNRGTSNPSTVEYTTVQPLDISPLDRQPSDRQIVHSSSFLESKLTTTTGYPTVGQLDMQLPEQTPDLFILVGAVAAYWEEEGLSEAQARKWCLDFEVEPPTMRQQLAWAQFDLETNSRRAEVKKDTISWFFGHLRKTGGAFPRPVNYKSPAELRAEAMEADLEQERAAKERIRKAEAEKRFQGILADPESADYKKLYVQVNDFAREAGGDALVHALRDAFSGSDV